MGIHKKISLNEALIQWFALSLGPLWIFLVVLIILPIKDEIPGDFFFQRIFSVFISIEWIIHAIYYAQLKKRELTDPLGIGFSHTLIVLVSLSGSAIIVFISFFFYLNGLDNETLLIFLPIPFSLYYLRKWIKISKFVNPISDLTSSWWESKEVQRIFYSVFYITLVIFVLIFLVESISFF